MNLNYELHPSCQDTMNLSIWKLPFSPTGSLIKINKQNIAIEDKNGKVYFTEDDVEFRLIGGRVF